MKKKSGIIFVAIFVLIIVIAIVLLLFKVIPNNKGEKIAEQLEVSLNRLEDDFYEAINEEILNDNELNSDKAYWGLFTTETQDRVDEKTAEIVKNIIAIQRQLQIKKVPMKISQEKYGKA